MTPLFLVACAILFVVPLVFVTHNVYEDGLIGRIGLLGISFSAATFLMEWAGGAEYQILPQTEMLVDSFAVFLIWHLFRFHRRVLQVKC
jgi:hypothetical protein